MDPQPQPMKPPARRQGGKNGQRSQRCLRVAIAQNAPIYLDKRASLQRALDIAKQAAAKDVELIAFGEAWFPGYPAWLDVCPGMGLWNHAPTKRVFAALRENSIAVPGPEVTRLAQAARKLKLTIVIGINEKIASGPGNGTLYNSLLTFTPEKGLANHHRKLVPTYTERIVWGNGDGRGLEAADIGKARVGGLICWEHWMPLARMAMHQSGEDVHIAVWPTAHEMHQVASRHYAFEGRCFVLCVGLIMQREDLPRELTALLEMNKLPESVLRGGSAIIAPDGTYQVPPIFDREELIIADLDLSLIDQEKMTLDVTGHYSRPDIFSFQKRS